MKYSDQIADWLVELGYTHCFYVGGGNIMHLIESVSRKLTSVPVIHEVAASIAAEYFNESSSNGKALALVTAGPGLTNIVTGMAGAYLESRELLVIGGQVKTADLARGQLRQRGIQEIDGVSIVASVSVKSVLIDEPIDFDAFQSIVNHHGSPRKGPVFMELPIDIQAREVTYDGKISIVKNDLPLINESTLNQVKQRLALSKRPLLLLGGGFSRRAARKLRTQLAALSIPIATTWNAADRLPADQYNYVGRPNTWGQRSANVVMQQTDLLIAVGSRLGMQQTGFNWQKFIPNGEVIQIDIDEAELNKGHPNVGLKVAADADDFLEKVLPFLQSDYSEWLAYAKQVRNSIPLVENVNKTSAQYISPYKFVNHLSGLCSQDDVVIPCSSGGAFTVMMQTFEQKSEQIIVTNKGLASMGYGLSGAIGASFANPDKRVILVEGDGGFAQNLQEIGTAAINQLNLKIFIFDDSGYASIRATQRNYFGGRYVGCDTATGLGLPNWEKLFAAWEVPTIRIGADYQLNSDFSTLFNHVGTAAFIVSIDPEQTYFPKITSRITESGSMESNPLHLMTPDLSDELWQSVSKYL